MKKFKEKLKNIFEYIFKDYDAEYHEQLLKDISEHYNKRSLSNNSNNKKEYCKKNVKFSEVKLCKESDDCRVCSYFTSNIKKMIKENILEIKRLVSELNCMGTYGLVELELNKIEEYVSDIETKNENSTIINFKNRYKNEMPTVKIQRGNKTLIQQRYDKEDLLKHLSEKYPDWKIVLSNF